MKYWNKKSIHLRIYQHSSTPILHYSELLEIVHRLRRAVLLPAIITIDRSQESLWKV
jgi:hypothetical protein